ncbi:putative DUF3617 family protein [Gammaproteobacteria bacterium]
MKTSTIAMILGLTTVSVFAQEMQPGQWEITLSMTTPNAPGQSFGPFTQSYCISPADVADPTRILGSVGATPSTCTYSNQQTSGNSLRFEISCQGAVPLNGSGQTSWTTDTMSTTLELSARMQNEATLLSTSSRMSARRIGSC